MEQGTPLWSPLGYTPVREHVGLEWLRVDQKWPPSGHIMPKYKHKYGDQGYDCLFL